MPIQNRALAALPSLSACLGFAYVFLLGGGAAYGIYYSMGWLLYGDAPIFHYIAWRILAGAAPYRDIFEINMPGTYLLHMFCLTCFGGSDFAFRLFDLFFAALAAAGIAAYGWRYSKAYAMAGGLLFIVCHLSWGALSMGERDFLMVPFLMAAAYVLRLFLENPQKTGAMFVFGLLVGCALWIKPVAAIFILLGIGAALLHVSTGAHKTRVLFCTGLGVFIPAALMHVWLYEVGALAAFYDIVAHFLPFYSRSLPLSWQNKALFLLIVLYGFLFAAWLLYRRSTVPAADKIVLSIGLLYGLLHFYVQGKGLWYHLYPLNAFACLYVAVVMPQLQCNLWENAAVQLVALSVCIHFSPLRALSREHLGQYEHAFSMAYLSEAARNADDALQAVPASIRKPYLVAHPHEAVLFLGISTGELWNLAYRQHWVTPSRQVYPYPLYEAAYSPYMARLSAGFFHDLATVKPLVIMVSSESWPEDDGTDYHAIDTKSPWQAFFARHYRLAKQTDAYRIYARIQ